LKSAASCSTFLKNFSLPENCPFPKQNQKTKMFANKEINPNGDCPKLIDNNIKGNYHKIISVKDLFITTKKRFRLRVRINVLTIQY
jgi:hypothetical protein